MTGSFHAFLGDGRVRDTHCAHCGQMASALVHRADAERGFRESGREQIRRLRL